MASPVAVEVAVVRNQGLGLLAGLVAAVPVAQPLRAPLAP